MSKDDTPILIVHGDKDALVPVQQSHDFHAALEKAGVASKLHIVKGGGHGLGFDRPEVPAMVRDFFIERLRTR